VTRERYESSHFTPMMDADENVERTCAKLLIYTGQLNPSEVTTLLGLSPTRMVVLGQRGRPNRLGRSAVGKVNGWFLSSEEFVESNDLRRHLDWLIAKLRRNPDGLRKLQAMEGVRMYVLCPWWSRRGGGGPSLWPEQMRGLADLNLECTVAFADYSEQKD